MKKILVLCTGNSCRSIIAEALVNSKLEGVEAKSAGVKASGKVNPNAQKILEQNSIWKSEYHSKTLEEVMNEEFDLVVTVCDHAKESCPMFPKPVKKLHMSFEDPDGKEFDAFVKTYSDIEKLLLPEIKTTLNI
jgi:arsenate reductase